MKATDLVISQHREVEQLFERLETADEGDKKVVREELAQALVAHSVIEKEQLYPAMREVSREEINHAYVEHSMVEYALSQLLATRPTDESFRAKLSVLKDLWDKHVQEEESEILKEAESALGQERLMRLGDEMEVRFNQVRAKGFKSFLRQALAETAPRLMPRAMAKKTAAKAPAAAKRATSLRAPARQAAQANPSPKRGAQGGRKGATQRGRGARASSR